jgi:hypothetical protein
MRYRDAPEPTLNIAAVERQEAERESWRRGWDLNPRVEVLQTSPLDLLGTAPWDFQYSKIGHCRLSVGAQLIPYLISAQELPPRA